MSTATNQLRIPSPRRAIALVSGAHFLSHFYLLLLPPLFPILVGVYGVGFTELGYALALFSLVSGLTQAPMGFAVDRYGARRILIAGVLLEGLVFVLIGALPSYGALLVLMAIAGLANSVYHPADYVILNASVPHDRIGRAFSLHTTAAYVGDALAPVCIVALIAIMDWQSALMLCGGLGLVAGFLLLLNSAALADTDLREASTADTARSGQRNGLALLFSLPVLIGLLFFTSISMYSRGVSGFGPSVLHLGFDTPLAQATTLVACYLFASPLGVLAGGWIADRIERHDWFAAICFLIVGLTITAVALFDPSWLAIGALLAVGGFFAGAVSPSRDMLIRAITPRGQVGKVFGFVSTGFNIGGIVAPPLFGAMIDNAEPRSVFWVTGLIAFATIAAVLLTGNQSRGSRSQT